MHKPNQAFAVEFTLTAPVIMDRAIGLPGVLARLIADKGEPDPLPLVPLHEIDGVFAGSDLFVLDQAVGFHVPYVRSLRPSAMTHDLALSDARTRRPLDQITLRDDRKNLLDFRTATSATSVVCFGQGCLAEVEALLQGLPSIGAKRSSGYGAIGAISITPVIHPHAGFADRLGRPTRPVPTEVWARMNLPPHPIRNLVARLPRWAAPREPCVGPRAQVMEVEDYERELHG
jgi:hypothetical protein